jgi:hypothetical protein
MKPVTDRTPLWRDGSVGLKTFYNYSTEQRNEYIKSILLVPVSERTYLDNHLIKFYNVMPEQPVKRWLSIEG